MSQPLVSLIVPSYNAVAYLDEFCSSVQQQTYSQIEVLIGDDGSTDDSCEKVRPYLKDTRFRLIKWGTNRGVHTGTVYLLMQARGEYWCSPGIDDVLMPRFVERRLAMLQERPDACLVHGPGDWVDQNGQPVLDDFTTRAMPKIMERMPSELGPEQALRMLVQHNIINMPSVMVRMDITRHVLPFFVPYWKWALDWYLWILLASTGFNFLWDSTVLHKYRVHLSSNSKSPKMQAIRLVESRLIPLHALKASSDFSPIAFQIWREYRRPLYFGWLVKAASLAVKGQLRPEDFYLGVNAFYGGIPHRVSIWSELLRYGITPWLHYRREQSAYKEQLIRVSGLASVNTPLFAK